MKKGLIGAGAVLSALVIVGFCVAPVMAASWSRTANIGSYKLYVKVTAYKLSFEWDFWLYDSSGRGYHIGGVGFKAKADKWGVSVSITPYVCFGDTCLSLKEFKLERSTVNEIKRWMEYFWRSFYAAIQVASKYKIDISKYLNGIVNTVNGVVAANRASITVALGGGATATLMLMIVLAPAGL